jgi:hydrogenase-1 operon protein HyaE
MSVAVAAAPLHPLLERFVAELDAPVLDAASYEPWAQGPGHALVFFSEDPVQYRETLDVAVIVPELAKAFPDRFRCALLLPAAAREIAVRYGFRRWPAIVLLRDGAYVGAIDGLRDWSDYLEGLDRLLAAEPSRPPSIGIAVKTAGAGDAPGCH